jgi:hypothetical protein
MSESIIVSGQLCDKWWGNGWCISKAVRKGGVKRREADGKVERRCANVREANFVP